MKYVGVSVPRVDAREKVTGQAVYAADVELPRVLQGAVLRSPLPHARIISIDGAGALRSPGVRAVVTGRDFPLTFGPMIKDQPFLALNRVRYVGEPVAVVAAESEGQAQEAVARIRVDYEELPAVFDPREALLEGAPLLHEKLAEYPHGSRYQTVPGTNIATQYAYSRGNVQAGLDESDQILEDEFFVHPVAHTPMETHAAVVQWTEDGKITIWSSTDAPHRRRAELADALGMPQESIRFLATYMGGGFGGKGALIAEALGVALARFTEGRPVRIVFSREEELTATQTRLGAYLKLKTGVKRDGTLIAQAAEILWDNGAYSMKAPEVSVRGALTIFGPYRIPHLRLKSSLVYTNKESSGAYRGFGTSQVTFASEVHMDRIAEKLNLDPLELRLKNAYREGDSYINGQTLYGVGLEDTLKEAARAIGWNQSRSLPAGSKVRGKGIAAMIKGTSTPTESRCRLKVDKDGRVTLLSGIAEIGAGQKTVLAQIAAETIGVPLDSVFFPNPDTDQTPYDYGATSSRTTFHAGNAVRAAGRRVREEILAAAAEILKVNSRRLLLVDGVIIEEDSGKRMDLRDLMIRKFGEAPGALIAEGSYTPAESPLLETDSGPKAMSSIFWTFATHAVEVEVDTETGVVKVLKVVAAHDVGRAVNPRTCEQQIEGAAVMGISNALWEEFKVEKGRVLNDTLSDYKIASIMDLPEIIPILVESSHPEAPYGAKGVGEPAAAATAPAIVNAIFDAAGIRLKDLPLNPEKVLSALWTRGKES